MLSGPRRQIRLSASAISDFKACPVRYRNGYVLGLKKIEDTESSRMGTNWHKLHEVYRKAVAAGAEDPFQAAIDHLNHRYSTMPTNLTPDEWMTERQILATSFAGYLWYWADDDAENTVVASEIPFELPLIHPKTGMPLPTEEVVVVGKIDEIMAKRARHFIKDFKSTSSSIDPGSDYWSHLRLDTQISTYTMAGRDMHRAGVLPEGAGHIEGAYYDVWSKPGIRPKKLSQADTKKFFESGEYMGSKFVVVVDMNGEAIRKITVDGAVAEFEIGKSGAAAIRETVEMYGARLLADIYEHPEAYFVRREIARTDKDIRDFRTELYNIYQTMRAMEKAGHWFHNEHACEATFKCPYIPLCYSGTDVTGGQTPEGFKRVQPVTVNGAAPSSRSSCGVS